MAENENDPIRRACQRNSVKPGSPLERTLRSHSYKFFGADGGALDEHIDKFIAEQKKDPFYASCFSAAPGPAKVAAALASTC
jgi:hypothetical protein